ncbi:hypothetical protein ABEM34_20795 [Escherichia coli]
MGSCAAPSAKGDDKFITTDYLQQCLWGIAELRWVVTLAAGLEDESQGMTVGKKLKLPPATWIREMIRHFQYDGQVIGTLSIA